MHRAYEIFEVLPDGSPHRVTVASGLEFAKIVLEGLASRTKDECFAADAKTRQVVMQLNVVPAKLRRIFQISYDEGLGLGRAELLRSRGFGVISVIGNDSARVLLRSPRRYDFFIIGYGAAEETRREMVNWLKAEYPTVKILAINPPNQQVLRADYNVPENWLPIVLQLPNVGNPAPNKASTSGA